MDANDAETSIMKTGFRSFGRRALPSVAAMLLGAGAHAAAKTTTFIVEAPSTASAKQQVREVGGRVLAELPDIDAVSASLSARQAQRLKRHPHVSLFADTPVTMQTAAVTAAASSVTTANGQATTYSVHLHRLDFGSIFVEDIDALVLPESSGNINLLGSNFLKRMASVEQRGGALILKQ